MNCKAKYCVRCEYFGRRRRWRQIGATPRVHAHRFNCYWHGVANSLLRCGACWYCVFARAGCLAWPRTPFYPLPLCVFAQRAMLFAEVSSYSIVGGTHLTQPRSNQIEKLMMFAGEVADWLFADTPARSVRKWTRSCGTLPPPLSLTQKVSCNCSTKENILNSFAFQNIKVISHSVTEDSTLVRYVHPNLYQKYTALGLVCKNYDFTGNTLT